MDLYREEILDHYRHPRNQGKLETADLAITETNASCGDEITLYLTFDSEGKVKQATFEGVGCAISQASISMLTEVLPELTVKELTEFSLEDLYELLGGPVNPGRVKCAALGFTALQRGLAAR